MFQTTKDGKSIWRDIYRWTFFLWIILFLFWGIWWLVAKRVPEFSQIIIEWPKTLNEVIHLPFVIVRWWDFIAVPFFVATYVSLYRINFGFCDDQASIRWGNWICGVVIGGFTLTIWVVYGYLISLIVAAFFLLLTALYSEDIAYEAGGQKTPLFFNKQGFVASLLFNLSSGMTIGLSMLFSFGLVPGLVIGLVSFLLITLFQYTLIKFFRIIYYLFKLRILPWLGVLKK